MVRSFILTFCLLFPAHAYAAGGEGSLLYGFTDPASNYAALALVIFLLIVWRFGGFKAASNALDERAEAIEAELEQARSLREAATESYSKARRRQEAADEEANKIVENAKIKADAMIASARRAMDESLIRKEAQLEARIARAEADAIADVKLRTIELAAMASATVLQDVDKDYQIDALVENLKASV